MSCPGSPSQLTANAKGEADVGCSIRRRFFARRPPPISLSGEEKPLAAGGTQADRGETSDFERDGLGVRIHDDSLWDRRRNV